MTRGSTWWPGGIGPAVRRSIRVLAAAAATAALSACGAPGGTDAVTRTADEWLAAARAGDAARLCALLSPAAALSAAAGGQTCPQALADLDLPGDGRVGAVQLWNDRAEVRAGTDTLFLVRLAAGWRVSGAGCIEQGDRPYDCDVAG